MSVFKEGEIVRAAGSPPLIVEDIRHDNMVQIVWFDDVGHLHRDCLHPNALERVPR